MTDRTKFEQMLELLINEEQEAAQELFHDIVVEKSRDIYESLLETDLEDEEVEEAAEEADDEELDEADDEEVDESEEELDEFAVEADDEMGGDPADDMIGDIEMDGDDEGDDMDDEGEEAGDDEVEDRIEDLEDALDELKAEFEAMMGGDDGEEGEEGDMDMDMDMDDEDEAEEEAFNFESADAEGEQLDEYTNNVAAPNNSAEKATSPVAKKNDMGGTTANIAKGSADEKGGKAETAKVDDAGNVNTKGGNKKAPAYSKASAPKSA